MHSSSIPVIRKGDQGKTDTSASGKEGIWHRKKNTCITCETWRYRSGIGNPVLSADREYSASVSITTNLANAIYNQDKDLTSYDSVQVENNFKLVKAQKERILQDKYNILLEEVDVRTKRSMALAREKDLDPG